MDAVAARIFLPEVVFLPGERDSDRLVDSIANGYFVAGAENWLALAAIQRMIESNPPGCLTLFGPPGSGKTHLLGILCRLWKEIWLGSSVVFSTATEFRKAFSEAIGSRNILSSRRQWENADLVVLDDLHFLAGYPAAQEEFTILLRAAERGKLHVAVACRIPPWYTEGLDPEIGAILQGGLSAPLQLPGEDARRALLRATFRQRSLAVTDAALQLFAEEVTGSPREIMGAVIKLHQAVGTGPVDYSVARAFLRRYAPHPTTTIDRVAKVTARYFGIRLKDLRGPARSRSEVLARNVAMYLSQVLTGASLEQIGNYFGGRDHSTVSHGCRRVEAFAHSDPIIQKALVIITDRVIPGQTNTFSASLEGHISLG
ncbi:MAG: DnaA/Hda family protein [Thermogutta sp.]